MPIKYKVNILNELKSAGYNTNIIRKEKLLSEGTLQSLRQGKYISMDAISKICSLLKCQPGDILTITEYENNEKMTAIEKALENLKNVILTKSEKKQQILTSWLNTWSKFLKREDGFKPGYLPYYKRGDIVYADFGFNVGAEFGGIHYAVVMETNNNKNNGNIIVVPLTSLDKNKSVSDIPTVDVYIGENVIGWTDAATIAKPNQIRAISKMRIVKPTVPEDKQARLTGEQMQLINKKLNELFEKPCQKSDNAIKKIDTNKNGLDKR